MNEINTCEICNDKLVITWTDTHGVAACIRCNSPYRIYHYEGDGENRKRIDKPPEILFRSDWVDRLKIYWQENKSRIPNGINMPGSSYEQCTPGDMATFNEYMDCEESHDNS